VLFDFDTISEQDLPVSVEIEVELQLLHLQVGYGRVLSNAEYFVSETTPRQPSHKLVQPHGGGGPRRILPLAVR
jgi:hypothetical protein